MHMTPFSRPAWIRTWQLSQSDTSSGGFPAHHMYHLSLPVCRVIGSYSLALRAATLEPSTSSCAAHGGASTILRDDFFFVVNLLLRTHCYGAECAIQIQHGTAVARELPQGKRPTLQLVDEWGNITHHKGAVNWRTDSWWTARCWIRSSLAQNGS